MMTFQVGVWSGVRAALSLLMVTTLVDSNSSIQLRTYHQHELIYTATNINNSSINYTIQAYRTRLNNHTAIQLNVLDLKLLSGDVLTFYDGNYSKIVEQYTAESSTPSFSVTSSTPFAHVQFTANTSDLQSHRNFSFLYRSVKKGLCNPIFFGASGRIISRKPPHFKSCDYTIKAAQYNLHSSVLLFFHNLSIPVGDRLTVWDTGTFSLYLRKRDPVFVLTHNENRKHLQLTTTHSFAIILEFNSTTSFDVTYQRYDYSMNPNVPISGESGEIAVPKRRTGRNFRTSYLITVPRGHVSISLKDLLLLRGYSDEIEILGYNGQSYDRLRVYDNSSELDTLTLVSANNVLLVKFVSRYSTGSFRLLYSTVNTLLKPCPKPDLNFVKTSSNATLSYEGWQQSISCVSGYASKKRHSEVVATCMADGKWRYAKELRCLRQCPPLSSLYNLTARGLWFSYRYEKTLLAGDNLTFFLCDDLVNYEQDEDKTLTCTASGTYSSPPPSCRKRKESRIWIVGVVLGSVFGAGTGFALVGMAIRYCQLRKKVLAQTVAVYDEHEARRLSEASPLPADSTSKNEPPAGKLSEQSSPV